MNKPTFIYKVCAECEETAESICVERNTLIQVEEELGKFEKWEEEQRLAYLEDVAFARKVEEEQQNEFNNSRGV